jgi:hypothetical protein
MRVGNYSVYIPEGVERESGHVALDHGKQYQLRLVNHDYRQSDAEVTIDGKVIGTFRLYGHGSVTLERSPHDNGRFTFYTSGTKEAVLAQEGAIHDDNKGLIQVRFVPEKYRKAVPVARGMGMRPMGMTGGYEGYERYEATSGGQLRSSASSFSDQEEKTAGGITGLSGHSDQRFVDVPGIDLDDTAAVLISIRLVTANTGPRPLQPTPRANKVPEPV